MSYRGGPQTIDQRVAEIEERLRRGESSIAATVVVTEHGLLDGLGDDDHPQYQSRDEQGLTYPDLVAGVVPDSQLPADLLRVGDVPNVDDLELLVWLNMGAP